MAQLSLVELAGLAKVLGLALDAFVTDGGQDVAFDDTPPNRTFALAVLNYENESGDEDDQVELNTHRGKIVLSPESLSGYFKHWVEQQLANAPAVLRDTLSGASTAPTPVAPVVIPVAVPVSQAVSAEAADILQLLELVDVIRTQMNVRAPADNEVWTYAASSYAEAVVRRAEVVLTADYPDWRLIRVFLSNKTRWAFPFVKKGANG